MSGKYLDFEFLAYVLSLGDTGYRYPLSDKDKRTSNKDILNKSPKKKIIPKGVKEFWYGDQVIYAINKKNADKKARKKGLI